MTSSRVSVSNRATITPRACSPLQTCAGQAVCNPSRLTTARDQPCPRWAAVAGSPTIGAGPLSRPSAAACSRWARRSGSARGPSPHPLTGSGTVIDAAGAWVGGQQPDTVAGVQAHRQPGPAVPGDADGVGGFVVTNDGARVAGPQQRVRIV